MAATCSLTWPAGRGGPRGMRGCWRPCTTDCTRSPPPQGLRRPFGTGERIVHLDLHPLNVMLTAAGPVVIDWTNAAAGPPGADVAMTYLIMASSDLDAVPWWIRPAAWSLRKVFLRRFRAAVRDDPGPYLAQVARYRLADVNVRPAEAARLLRLAEGDAGDSEGVIRGDAHRGQP